MLHTVNKSPFERNAMDSCLRLSRDNDAVLFYEDGIYATLKGTTMESRVADALKTKKVYVLTPDLEARGMGADDVIDGIQAVDYAGFVELVTESTSVQAWL